MEPVSSTRNQRVVRAGRLHRARDRRASGLTLIEGPHVLAEAVEGGADIREVFGLPEDTVAESLSDRAGAEWVPVTQTVLDKLAPTAHPRGPVAVIEIPEATDTDGDLVWTDLADPGNAGTIIRTAAAFGFDVVVAEDAVDPWSPKVIRAGAGGHFRTTVKSGPVPGVMTVATVPHGGVPVSELAGRLGDPVCLLIGNEAHGLTQTMVDSADLRVTIAMPGGVESLNASIAAAIILYEISRTRFH